ncbi:hypothetical protein VIGAN_UM099600, partial [Vigna angularis var. angularis]
GSFCFFFTDKPRWVIFVAPPGGVSLLLGSREFMVEKGDTLILLFFFYCEPPRFLFSREQTQRWGENVLSFRAEAETLQRRGGGAAMTERWCGKVVTRSR